MKRIAMVLALLLGSFVMLGTSPAMATPEKCYDTVVDQPAHDEQVVDTPAQDAVPGVDAVPGKDAVYVIEYKFVHKHGQVKWKTDPNWNADDNPQSKGWESTGETRNGELISEAVEGTPAIPGKDAVPATYKTVTIPATYKDVEVPCEEPPPVFEPYEVEVCWTMDNSDGVEGTYEWPQTRSATCTPVPACEEVIEIQRDLYMIENKEDEDYLAGLTVLNSPADDASLSPHGYYSKVFTGADCVEPPVDVCPDVDGNQPEGTDCNPVVPPVEEPPVVEPPVEEPPVTEPPVEEPPATPPTADTPNEPKVETPVVTTDVDQVLPSTGGVNKALIAVALLAVVAGAYVFIKGRRRNL